MFKFFKIFLAAFLLLAPFTTLAQPAPERITNFQSNIQIQKDGSILVTETIAVVSQNIQINHGIYRDLPIAYTNKYGQRYLVDFKIISITRNGAAEPYHTQKAGNGVRIYLGSENATVPTGSHVYELTYKMKGILGFFENHDELYWNVTGQGWVFPIQEAKATVNLPEAVESEKIRADFYTGAFGSTAKDANVRILNSGAEFTTTQELKPNEGLTIVFMWPKGIVSPPTKTQTLLNQARANSDLLAGTLGALLVFCFYFYMWHTKGRDPKKGTVIPQYSPPQNLSPAMLRHIIRMGTDDKALSAAIISLGTKKALKITEEKKFLNRKEYTLTKLESTPEKNISEEEKILLDGFFKSGPTYKLEKSNAKETQEIKYGLFDSLKKQAGKKYFVLNTGAFAIGLILSIFVFFSALIFSQVIAYRPASGLLLLFLPVLGISLVAMLIVFWRLLKAYTPEGRKLADQILGFKEFLSVTEKDRLNFHNPPEQTPELFEQMLPYALALGVEHKWAEQFSTVFSQLEQKGNPYSPLWYHGAYAHFSADAFASSVGKSFSGAVSSASVPPGSSSGSGGFSGGGGGGGGGGGW